MNISAPAIHKSAKKTAMSPLADISIGVRENSNLIEIRVFTEMAKIAADWQQFEKTALHTVFQTFHWVNTWQQHIGARAAIQTQNHRRI